MRHLPSAALAWVSTALLLGCGQREAALNPSGEPNAQPLTTPAPAQPDPKEFVAQKMVEQGEAPRKKDADTDEEKLNRLLRELAEARQPGIYFTLQKLDKPELHPHLARFHANPEQRAQIARSLLKMVLNDDGTAAGVMRVWVIPEQVPALVEYLQNRNKLRQEVIRALAEIKDTRSVEAIAKHFPHLRDTCSKALVKLGPELSGKAVLPYLYYPDHGVANEAQRLSVLFKVDADLILDQTLLDLKADEPKRRAFACDWLLKADPRQPRRAEIAKALEPLIAETKGEVNRRALPGLMRFGDADNLPALVAYLLERKNVFDRKGVALYLGKSKDERAVVAVVKELETTNAASARKAIEEMGSMTEKEVVKYLDHPETSMRNDAAKLLQVVGTRSSVPALERAVSDKNSTVQSNAKKALRQIAERTK